MVRKQITITIDEKILKEFRKYCEENDINMSKRIERYMKKDLEKSKK
jgi:post-segregation antitoxin (ccd killing protein)